MSTDVTPVAYRTRLGNLTAKSVLALLADASNDEGYGWPSVERIAEKTEIHARTVLRVLQVFADIGLIVKVDRGRGKNFGIQLAIAKLGTDLREAFADAYTTAQSKRKQTLHIPGDNRPSKCRSDIKVSVSETPENVAETLFSVAETVPPHPLNGGTAIEPYTP